MQSDLHTVLPSTQRQAYRVGSKFYFNGNPCIRGHVCPRYESSGGCVECLKLVPNRQWHKNNPEKYRAYIEGNRAAIRKRKLKRYHERVNEDPLYALKIRVRSLVRSSLRRRGYGKMSQTAKILGCAWDEFARHIELQFLPGMTWGNAHLWEIDHITPLATAKSDEDVIALNHFTNLRPLWEQDNRSKKDNITHLL